MSKKQNFKSTDIKPIPKYMLEKIRKYDEQASMGANERTRFYAYLTKIRGELVKITVAVKRFYGVWHCKQVVAYGVKSKVRWLRDIAHKYIAGYQVGWQNEGYRQHAHRWWSDGVWNEYKVAKSGLKWNPWARVINTEFVSKFDEYKYSLHNRFGGECVIDYLRVYEKFPQVEFLIKFGMYHLWNSVTILKQMGKDKFFCRWLFRHRREISLCKFYVATILKSYKTGRAMKEIQTVMEFKKNVERSNNTEIIRDLFGKNLDKLALYLDKNNVGVSTYSDYLTACKNLNLCLTKKQNLFPANFKEKHDQRIDEYSLVKSKLDAEKRVELYKNFGISATKYLSLQSTRNISKSSTKINLPNRFVAIIATSPAELIHEGEALKHCVGKMNYEDRVVRGESLIFFVRASQSPTEPFVTVEYSLSKRIVLQCYGKNNAKPDDEVLHFVNKIWLPHANKKIKNIEKFNSTGGSL